MRGLGGAIRITRPLNCLAALIGVLIGGYLSSPLWSLRLWLAALVAALLTAGGNTANDFFDIEIDRINKPQRVLPAGELSPTAGRNWSLFLSAVGLGLTVTLGIEMAVVAVVIAILMYLYSWRLKPSFLVGNALVAIMSAMPVIYGGMAVGRIAPTLAPASVVLSFMLCREVLKTVEDYEGDLRVGARTIAVVWGKTGALRLFALLALLVACTTELPWAFRYVSPIYLALIVPGVDVVLLATALILLRRPTSQNIKKALVSTKAQWFLWTTAMFLGIGLKL